MNIQEWNDFQKRQRSKECQFMHPSGIHNCWNEANWLVDDYDTTDVFKGTRRACNFCKEAWYDNPNVKTFRNYLRNWRPFKC